MLLKYLFDDYLNIYARMIKIIIMLEKINLAFVNTINDLRLVVSAFHIHPIYSIQTLVEKRFRIVKLNTGLFFQWYDQISKHGVFRIFF